MILQVYTLFDKKTKSFAPFQFAKDDPKTLEEVYHRSAVKNIKDFDKYRDMVLKHVGTFDDTTGTINTVLMTDVIDFDSLILEIMEVNNE